MSLFHDVLFPLPISFGASGGPEIKTEIIQLASGREYRGQNRSQSLRRYDAGVGVKSVSDLQTLLAFFEARRGQLYVFRFRDPLDHAAVNEVIGQGDGSTTKFLLTKTYGGYVRAITKAVDGSCSFTIDGETISANVNYQTGEVIFSTPPDEGSTITASFEFDVPVRFDMEHLSVAIETFGAGKVIHIPLMEVLDHA